MLSTRLLPPQFLLPAWSARQLAQAAQRAHKSDYTKSEQDKDTIKPVGQLTHRQLRRRGLQTGVFRLNLKPVEVDTEFEVERGLHPRRASRKGWHGTEEQLHEPDSTTGDYNGYDSRTPKRRLSQQYGMDFELYTSSEPPGDVQRTVRKAPPQQEKVEVQSADQEPQPKSGGISLFEELFPEEALAQQKREKNARERLEKLPAFNWNFETHELDAWDRNHKQARQQKQKKYQTIPGVRSDHHQGRTSPAKQIPQRWPDHERGQSQQIRQDESSRQRTRASVLVLQACSKTLEESDFYRVGPKGNHIETWTNGILKVIPARDNVTLEPLGQYFLLFSSLAAARLYLDKTIRLAQLTRSSDYFSRPGARLRDEEDFDAVKRNFTLVPAGGKLSLRLLQPPYSKGLQWMINAGGPAPLVARQSKSQNIVLFSTDRGYIKHFDLENAIMDDGKRRNLHWKLAGARNESIVKLESKATTGEEAEAPEGTGHSPRSTYRGPARYALSFKDSNEARRFAREWHRRPFPTKRSLQPGDDAPPIVNAEILW